MDCLNSLGTAAASVRGLGGRLLEIGTHQKCNLLCNVFLYVFVVLFLSDYRTR